MGKPGMGSSDPHFRPPAPAGVLFLKNGTRRDREKKIFPIAQKFNDTSKLVNYLCHRNLKMKSLGTVASFLIRDC